VGGDAVLYFDVTVPETLVSQLTELLPLATMRSPRVDALRVAAAKRAAERFSWDRVTDLYWNVLARLAR